MFMAQCKLVGSMATVIGIFENCYINKKSLPVVRPGTNQGDLLI